jgi:hypothetical protein
VSTSATRLLVAAAVAIKNQTSATLLGNESNPLTWKKKAQLARCGLLPYVQARTQQRRLMALVSLAAAIMM